MFSALLPTTSVTARAVGHCTCGTAATFDEARADFEAAWRVFLSKRTEVDFQEWRDQRDWTARKYAMWEAGEGLPSQRQFQFISSRSLGFQLRFR
jgi:hypothetical protein